MSKDKLAITMNELFSGIGAQKSAMDRLGIDCKIVGISDIDKYANQSYYAIHGQTRQYGDISKIDHLDYADLWTYSFPCQDLSVAGKQAGIKDGTRSGLLFEVERLLDKAVKDGTQPKYLLLENVKAFVSKKFMHDFQRWLNRLDEMGYKNYWKVLNAKNYGVPQNRERVFVVSIRKDLNQSYEFPKEIPLTKRLKDVLETNVDDKYYLSEKKIQGFLHRQETNNNGFAKNGINIRNDKEYATTLTARMAKCGMTDNYIKEPLVCASRGRNPDNPSDRTVGAPTEQRLEFNKNGTSNTITTVQKDNYVVEPQIIQENGNLYPNTNNPQAGRVYNTNGISPALDTMQDGNREPKIIDEIYKNRPPHQYGDYSPTLRASHAGDLEVLNNLRIRKITPKECWRLMGFTDEEFDKAQASGVSNSQLYKQAGNSIVVDVLVAIFRNLFL